MSIEKDFIQREIQRLNLLLTGLIKKVKGLQLNNSPIEIEKTNEVLKSEFNLSLKKLSTIKNSELLKRISELNESHTEKLTELMYEIVINNELPEITEYYDKKKIAENTLLIIDFLNKNSTNFSMNRMSIANVLAKKGLKTE